jgi:hypothetical protein
MLFVHITTYLACTNICQEAWQVLARLANICQALLRGLAEIHQTGLGGLARLTDICQTILGGLAKLTSAFSRVRAQVCASSGRVAIA